MITSNVSKADFSFLTFFFLPFFFSFLQYFFFVFCHLVQEGLCSEDVWEKLDILSPRYNSTMYIFNITDLEFLV